MGVSINPSGMSPGSYSGTISIYSNDPDENPKNVQVQMNIPNHAPIISSVTASPDPVKGGATITMTANGEVDEDIGQTVYLYCDTSSTPTSANTDCTGGDRDDPSGGSLSLWCEFSAIQDDSTHTEYCRLYDGTSYSGVKSDTYTSDSTPPDPVNFNPISGSDIYDSTQTFIFATNDVADCYASYNNDESYDTMIANGRPDCTVGQSTSHTCTTEDLGSDGLKNIYISCKDTLENKDSASTNEYITYNLITSADYPPNVDLVFPANNNISYTGNVIFNCSATDDHNLKNITLYTDIDGTWKANQTKTLTSIYDSETFTINNIPDDTNFKWNCLVYDNASQSDWGNSNYSVNVIILDTQSPVVNLISISNNETITTTNNATFYISVTDDIALANCTLYTDITGSWIANDTHILTGTINSATWYWYNIDNGTYDWNTLCYDISGNSAWNPTNFTFKIDYSPITNIAPTNSTIISPNGGETYDSSAIINWTQSMDENNYVRYFLQYSDDSGVSWYDIISNYGYENRLNDSSTEKSITFTGNENKTVYIRIPKNAVIMSASLNIIGEW